MQDRDTRRVNRLYDFTKAQFTLPGKAYCIAERVNSSLLLEGKANISKAYDFPLEPCGSKASG